MNKISDHLNLLGYNPLWIKHGFIDKTLLSQQVFEFLKGHDINTEHYRYAGFRHWINSHTAFSDTEVTNFITLVTKDPDPVMSASAALDLLKRDGIKNNQFDTLANFIIRFSEGYLRKHVIRITTLRQLKSMKHMENSEFIQFIDSAYPIIHEYLLERVSHNNLYFLEILTRKGTNKRIRNQAKERLKQLSGNKTSAKKPKSCT